VKHEEGDRCGRVLLEEAHQDGGEAGRCSGGARGGTARRRPAGQVQRSLVPREPQQGPGLQVVVVLLLLALYP